MKEKERKCIPQSIKCMIAEAMPDDMLKRSGGNGVFSFPGRVEGERRVWAIINIREIRQFSRGAKLDFFLNLFDEKRVTYSS